MGNGPTLSGLAATKSPRLAGGNFCEFNLVDLKFPGQYSAQYGRNAHSPRR